MSLDNYPEELCIQGRPQIPTSEFKTDDKLYHAFNQYDLDDEGEIKPETIRFPDFSCNWNRFSLPYHVRFRINGNMQDGCYSFIVETARYLKMANVVHDPIDDPEYPNYSHIEVRRLKENEDIDFEPPKGRKWKSGSTKLSKKMKYRQNIKNNLKIELEISEKNYCNNS